VAEGLGGLMKSAVKNGVFKGISIDHSDCLISHLQYADDTLSVGEASSEIIWGVKSILRIFELSSGLKVNFHKSRLYGINTDESFTLFASDFLHCKVGTCPFKFLGLPMGARIRALSTLKSILDKMLSKLQNWKFRYLSLRARVTLFNSVINSIPIYHLSIYKIPKPILKRLIAIQRSFLWGGANLDKKIPWVCWDQVYLSKEMGGLGVRNIIWVNHSLLSKWWWRILENRPSLLNKLLDAKCGPSLHNWLFKWVEPSLCRRQTSRWWQDLCSFKYDSRGQESWLVKNLIKNLIKNYWFWRQGVPLERLVAWGFSLEVSIPQTLSSFSRSFCLHCGYGASK
jgi:hypothetical protein